MSASEDVSQAARSIKHAGAKTGIDVADGTRKRVTAAVTLRKKDRLELMTKRRMENDSDDDQQQQQSQSSSNTNNGEPAGRGSHRYHEQHLDPQELYGRMNEFIDMVRTDPAAAAAAAANASDADRGGATPQAAAAAAESVAVQRVRDGLKYTRQLLRLESPSPFPLYRAAGGVSALMALTGCPDHELCYNAVWCLTTMATGTEQDVECVIAEGIVPKMIECLVHEYEKVRHQAAWCLGNICGDGPAHRDLVLRHGGMHAALACIRGRRTPNGPEGEFVNERPQTLRNCVWLIAQICRFKPSPALSEVAICLPTLQHLLATSDDEEVLDDCIWAVSFISDGSLERIQAVLDAGDIMQRIVTTFQQTIGSDQDLEEGRTAGLFGPRHTAILPCLRTFGNFTAKEESTDYVFQWGVISHLAPFLQAPDEQGQGGMHRTIRKEACWILSNCLAGTPEQAKQVLDAQLVPALVRNIDVPEFEVKKEAVWAIANLAIYCPTDVIRYMVESCNVMNALVRVLSVPEERSNQLALEALEPIFRAGISFMNNNNGRNPYADRFDQLGGTEMLHSLLHHTSNAVSMDCAELLRNYFSADAEDDIDPTDGHWDLPDNGGGGGGGYGNVPDGFNNQGAPGWGN